MNELKCFLEMDIRNLEKKKIKSKNLNNFKKNKEEEDLYKINELQKKEI